MRAQGLLTLWARPIPTACVCIYVCMCARHRVSRPRGTGSVGDSVGEGHRLLTLYGRASFSKKEKVDKVWQT